MSDVAATVLPRSVRLRIFAYLACLVALVAFSDPNGGLLEIPISFLLKNGLKLEAGELARFRAIAGLPLYLSFLFGLARDAWNPLGIRDRGLIGAFSLISAALYLVFAFLVPVSYTSLLIASLLLTTSFLFVSSAQSGLASTLAQQHAMSGQVSAVWNVFASLPVVAAFLMGGLLSDTLARETLGDAGAALFSIGALGAFAVAGFALFKPRAVFDNLRVEQDAAIRPLADLRRLAKHRPAQIAMLVWLLWNFAPGSTTPLQYHLQNKLGGADADWGTWNAVFAVSFVPAYAAFGFLCRRYTLRRLLWIGTLLAVPQFVPLLFAGTLSGALIAAAPMGFMGGVATAAYLALTIRACPKGLEGTTLMLSGGLYYVSTRIGDLLGTWLYEKQGDFTVCVALITLVYAAILPVLLLVPKELVDTTDDEVSSTSLA